MLTFAAGAPADAQSRVLEDDKRYVNSIGMCFVHIPAGEFTMGSPETEPMRGSDEALHRVRISRSFLLCIHEVRVRDFAAFVQATNYQTSVELRPLDPKRYNNFKWLDEQSGRITWRNPGFPQTEKHPVVHVTWSDADTFCRWLSTKEKRHYQLPSEAQWEYACRAGMRNTYPGGNNPENVRSRANVGDYLYARHIENAKRLTGFTVNWYDWFPLDDGYTYTAPVGRYLPNGFGLYDMTGNVAEFCRDYLHTDAYRKSPRDDPDFSSNPDPNPVLSDRPLHVVRGGSFLSCPPHARIANRAADVLDSAGPSLGFRVMIVIEPANAGLQGQAAATENNLKAENRERTRTLWKELFGEH